MLNNGQYIIVLYETPAGLLHGKAFVGVGAIGTILENGN